MKKLLWILSLSLLSFLAYADDSLSIVRTNPNTPISRSDIIAAIEHRYEKSRILSMQARPSNAAPDCHVARILKPGGELLAVYVAC